MPPPSSLYSPGIRIMTVEDDVADLYSSVRSKVRAHAAPMPKLATAKIRARLPQEEHVQGGQVPGRHLRALRLLSGIL